MAETPSTMLPLGTSAPNFKLPDPSGKLVSRLWKPYRIHLSPNPSASRERTLLRK